MRVPLQMNDKDIVACLTWVPRWRDRNPDQVRGCCTASRRWPCRGRRKRRRCARSASGPAGGASPGSGGQTGGRKELLFLFGGKKSSEGRSEFETDGGLQLELGGLELDGERVGEVLVPEVALELHDGPEG